MSVGKLKQNALLTSADATPVILTPRKKVEQATGSLAKHDDPENRIVYLDGDVSTLEYYVCDFDINSFGLRVYQASTAAVNCLPRIGIGALAITMGLLSPEAIRRVLSMRRKRLEYKPDHIRRVRGQAKLAKKKASWLLTASSRARSMLSAARRLASRSPHALLRLAGAGSTAFTYLIMVKDLSQWMADAFSDWATRYTYSWNDTFSRDHFSRMRAILKAGTEAKLGKRNGGVIAISGSDIKLMAILCASKVVGSPVDIATSSIIAQTLSRLAEAAAKSDETIDELLERTKIQVFIGDPNNAEASETALKDLEVEFKQLLLRFERSIRDVSDWDAEDLIVPLVAIAERFVKIPGLAIKVLGTGAGSLEALIFNSYDEDTLKMIDALDESVVSSDNGVLGVIKDRILDFFAVLGFTDPADAGGTSLDANIMPGGI